MEKRTLGASGLEVSALGLGCMTMTGGYGGRPDREEMITLLHAAVDRGVTFFDTAEIYGPHANEELVGEALAPVRDQVVIATKFAQDIDPVERTPARPDAAPRRAAAGAWTARCRGSGSTSIDLYYQHRVNPDVPIEEFAGAVRRPRRGREGEALRDVRGRRGDDPPGARRAAGDRRAERVLAVVAPPRGGRAGRLRRARHRLRPLQPARQGLPHRHRRHRHHLRPGQRPPRAASRGSRAEALQHNTALVDEVRAVAAARASRPGQVALAWLLAQQPWVVPIPGHDEAAPARGEPRGGRPRPRPPTSWRS